MAKKLTKNTLPVREYQVWTSANMSDGDILDVYGSLGGRIADTVTMESNLGPSTVRLNVSNKVFGRQGGVSTVSGQLHNAWVDSSIAALRNAPILIKEVEDTGMPNILIENGTTQTWKSSEIGVRDIKIVNASGLRITVT